MAGGANKGRPHTKTIDRCRIAARIELRNLGMHANDIARLIGISPTAFSILKKTHVYRNIKNEIFIGVVGALDNDIEKTYELNNKRLRQGVPVALENLLALAADRTDKRVCLEASKEILDREGRHAKVSRLGIATIEQGGVGTKADDDIVDELTNALFKVKKEQEINQEPVTETVQ